MQDRRRATRAASCRSAANRAAGTSRNSRASSSSDTLTSSNAVRSSRFSPSNAVRSLASGSLTKVPPLTPRAVVIRFCDDNIRSASRTVLRLTPNRDPSLASTGSCVPGGNSPRMIRLLSSAATFWYARRGLAFSRSPVRAGAFTAPSVNIRPFEAKHHQGGRGDYPVASCPLKAPSVDW